MQKKNQTSNRQIFFIFFAKRKKKSVEKMIHQM